MHSTAGAGEEYKALPSRRGAAVLRVLPRALQCEPQAARAAWETAGARHGRARKQHERGDG
eukprot:4582909-Pyramimonas_sp.AAC.1